MIIEYIRYKIERNQHKSFECAYNKAQVFLKKSPHCLGWKFSHCVEDPNSYTLRIEWNSLDEHLKGISLKPRVQIFLPRGTTLLNNIEEMCHYEVTIRDEKR